MGGPLGSRKQETGSRKQETGGRKQETGNRKQETGNRKQETGNRKQEAERDGSGRREAAYRKRFVHSLLPASCFLPPSPLSVKIPRDETPTNAVSHPPSRTS
jgi:hypothetical protein